MIQGISVSFSPIGSWPFLVGAVLAVTVLTLWAYSRRLKGTAGRWRWCRAVAAAARLAALSAGGAAAVGLPQGEEEARRLVVVLLDASTSMLIGDEVRGQTRWEVASKPSSRRGSSPRPSGPTSTSGSTSSTRS